MQAFVSIFIYEKNIAVTGNCALFLLYQKTKLNIIL